MSDRATFDNLPYPTEHDDFVTLDVSWSEVLRYSAGELVQVVWPRFTPHEREALLRGEARLRVYTEFPQGVRL